MSKPKFYGYPQVADFIATDKELAVYRRFDRTASRVLLQLQTEIIVLQTKLDKIDAGDAADQDEKRQAASATIYEELLEPRDHRDEEKQRIYSKLRTSLKEYCILNQI